MVKKIIAGIGITHAGVSEIIVALALNARAMHPVTNSK
jgi:hypothetical protein